MTKTTIPDEMKIATCKICTLATTMRDCKQCPFNIGLLHKSLDLVAQIQPLTSLAPIVRDNFIAQIKDNTVSLNYKDNSFGHYKNCPVCVGHCVCP